MKNKKYSIVPLDVKDRINLKPVVCYPIDTLKEGNLSILHKARKNLKNIGEIIIPVVVVRLKSMVLRDGTGFQSHV